MADLASLIAELERADGPSFLLERMIDETVFPEREAAGLLPRNYTSIIDAALTLVPEGFVFALGDCGEEDMAWACVTAPDPDNRDFDCRSAATPALALCIACLKARMQIPSDTFTAPEGTGKIIR